VKIEGDDVMVELPAVEEVDAILGTNGLRVTKSDCIDITGDALKVPVRSSVSLVTEEAGMRNTTLVH